MMVPDSSSLLVNLDPLIYVQLRSQLDENDEWKKVAKEIFQRPAQKIAALEGRPSPATQLLLELESQQCDIQALIEILTRCQLKGALCLITPPQRIAITKQPVIDVFVELGGELKLEVEVSGNPLPQYLWFRDNVELTDQTKHILVKENFTEEDEGEYTCIVTQEYEDEENEEEIEIASEPVEVRLLPEAVNILRQPDNVDCLQGEDIELTCVCEGSPAPVYQWCHENTLLSGMNTETLMIKNASLADGGEYHCYITNGYSEAFSKKVSVLVSPVGGPSTPVSEKVALLIANQDYSALDPLTHSINDVETLAKILTNLGFKVLALCNLTLIEMRNAVQKICQAVPEDAYVLFYYAGHGFELYIKCMLPVDAPADFLFKDSLCEGEVLQEFLNTKPRLFFLILDMCLTKPNENDNEGIFSATVPQFEINDIRRNFIQIYSTASYLSAYEFKSETNGIYMKHLKKFLPKDLPIIDILDETQRSICIYDPQAANKQIPQYIKSVVQQHYLTHPSTGNARTIEIFHSWNSVDSPKGIYFQRTRSPARGLVTFKKYKDTFNNILELRIMHLSRFPGIKCQIPFQEIPLRLEPDEDEFVLQIFDLQKLKLQVALSITITLMKDDVTEVDNCILELSKPPLIVSAELWYKRPQLGDLPPYVMSNEEDPENS